MIEKERLEELIKQEATIWCPYYMFDEEGIQLDNKDYIDGEILYVVNEVWKDNFRKQPLKLEYLFETKEEAEFALKYQNITRTETLSLPTWEEIKKEGSSPFFAVDVFLGFITPLKVIIINKYGNGSGEGYIEKIFEKPLTKENYYAACELCRKLFLGEEV